MVFVFTVLPSNNHLGLPVFPTDLLHCAICLAAQCIVIGPVCGGRVVSAPYYSQRAVFASLSALCHSFRVTAT